MKISTELTAAFHAGSAARNDGKGFAARFDAPKTTRTFWEAGWIKTDKKIADDYAAPEAVAARRAKSLEDDAIYRAIVVKSQTNAVLAGVNFSVLEQRRIELNARLGLETTYRAIARRPV